MRSRPDSQLAPAPHRPSAYEIRSKLQYLKFDPEQRWIDTGCRALWGDAPGMVPASRSGSGIVCVREYPKTTLLVNQVGVGSSDSKMDRSATARFWRRRSERSRAARGTARRRLQAMGK